MPDSAAHRIVTPSAVGIPATLSAVKSTSVPVTSMRNVFVPARFGEPVSVTRTVTKLVVEAWASDGIHWNTPSPDPIVAPSGNPASRLNESEFGGTSVSVAVTPRMRQLPGFRVTSPIPPTTGGTFTSLIVTAAFFSSPLFVQPLSVTRNITDVAEGPSNSSGVHVKSPLVGSIEAAAGASGPRLYHSRWAGTSVSVAETTKARVSPSFVIQLPSPARTGGALLVDTMFGAPGVGIAMV